MMARVADRDLHFSRLMYEIAPYGWMITRVERLEFERKVALLLTCFHDKQHTLAGVYSCEVPLEWTPYEVMQFVVTDMKLAGCLSTSPARS